MNIILRYDDAVYFIRDLRSIDIKTLKNLAGEQYQVRITGASQSVVLGDYDSMNDAREALSLFLDRLDICDGWKTIDLSAGVDIVKDLTLPKDYVFPQSPEYKPLEITVTC